MNQTVNIPFNIRLEAGDSSFSLDLSDVALHHPTMRYGFTTVTLCPDYYSSQAFKLDMDSERELKEVISNPFSLEVEFDRNAYDEKSWNPSTTSISMSTLLKSLNTHFEEHKPKGCDIPLVAFDWIHLNSLSAETDVAQFHQNLAEDFYGEPYNAAKHNNNLPTYYRNLMNLNNLVFPTQSKLLEFVRIRITLALNTTIAFANSDLPESLGFSEVQIPGKVNKQIQFVNPSKTTFLRFVCHNPALFPNKVYTTKIHLYPSNKTLTSEMGKLETTKERERKHNLMAADYNTAIVNLAKTVNVVFSLTHDTTNKKFNLVFPENRAIRVTLIVPPYIGHMLGYGHVSNITSKMSNVPYPTDLDIEDVEKTARVLVYDAGMVVISLDETSSQQTYQFTNTFMALLEPEFSGVLKTPLMMDLPFVPVSQFRKQLTFVLSRFSERNQPTPLDWKVGAYVRGMLVGKV